MPTRWPSAVKQDLHAPNEQLKDGVDSAAAVAATGANIRLLNAAEQLTKQFQWKNLQMSSSQPSGDSKTITISIEKLANVFTATFWRFQNINNGLTAASRARRSQPASPRKPATSLQGGGGGNPRGARKMFIKQCFLNKISWRFLRKLPGATKVGFRVRASEHMHQEESRKHR